jgi:hypothetical protein
MPTVTGKDRQLGIGPLNTVGLAGGRSVAHALASTC